MPSSFNLQGTKDSVSFQSEDSQVKLAQLGLCAYLRATHGGRIIHKN